MWTFHAWWAYVLVVWNLLVAVWGLVMVVRKMAPNKVFFGAAIAGHLIVAVQVVIGVIMFQRVEPPWQHTFYGFVLLLAAVLSYSFIGREPRRMLVTFTIVALFLGSVGIRAMTTA